jgi:putative Mg2+ transporter-C (MgtC) family protein
MWEWLALDAPDAREMTRITVRLVVAATLAGLLGYERRRRGKAAGLRTHILVALGAAVFTIAMLEAGGDSADVSRVIQGVAAGIGFVGAGAILKATDRGEIRGLTTAAGIWMTAGIGVAVGAGRFWLPVLATVLALVALAFLRGYETRGGGDADDSAPP